MMFDSIKFAHQNLRKSATATQELLSELENKKIDIILIQEPHTHNSHRILGFPSRSNLFQTDENILPKTGIFINNKNLMAKKLDKYTNCWMTTVQVQLSKSLLIISNVYIEPNTISSSHIDLLKDLMKTFANHPLILSGDLNARHTLWHDRIINRHGESICELINDFDLHIHNDESPTCLTINGNSIIDLTLSNYKARSFIRNWASTVHQHSIFDHALIEFEYASNERIPQRISNTTRRFNERKADWTKFNELIDQESVARITQNIEHTNNTNTIDHNILELTRIIQKAAFNSMPTIKRSTYHKRSNWWDTELKMMQIVFNSKRYLFSKERNPEARQHLYDDFKSFRNKYIRMIRKKRLKKWREFIEEIDTNNTWGNTHKLIRQKLNPQSHTLPIIEDFPYEDHPKIIENIVNSMFPTHRSSQEYIGHNTSLTTPEHEYNISKEYIESLISKTSSRKAPGDDNITYNMLKASKGKISESLAKIFSKCLNIGYFPKQWKKASLIIFPKANKSDYHLCQNYRPISLLPSIGKLLEKIVQSEIQNFLISNNKINPQQHGFIPNKSTITALHSIKAKILTEKRNKLTSLIAIDFTGAFDSADWNIILNNMHQLQVPQHLIQMMHSYFQRRTITMKHNTIEYSKNLSKGCPQGSPLSPLLWNILINKLLDTFSSPNASIYAYADDLTVICSATKIEDLHVALTDSLNFINSFSNDNQLKINFSKTKILNFHKLSFPHPISIDSNTIEIVNNVKVLGVIFENHHIKSKINFTSHIKSVVNKSIKIKNLVLIIVKIHSESTAESASISTKVL
ncbi:Retrovirus-related Pol polyprotein from type-1 retrotransposable element R1 [Sarcoptes scabiei]|uniref:Retrovirus-related Pol polyprotein from type-1 retrotransposable element R1 n=1 Tax=Sarcoptes scabiei TaxID=52283 RepID=A0A834RHQ3_SARSC|nr:Retrovirus-related Pol polyprotein from type-1 retrotransposable element R1 [Sarcoptes scabiei]